MGSRPLLTIEHSRSAPIRYCRNMRLLTIAAFAVTAGLFLAPVRAQQAAPKAPEHNMSTPQAGGMMDHDKMMADMKAADARLATLVQTMTSARGDDKVAAIQALLTELVSNQVDMHRQMALMHDHMMSQMPRK